MRHCSWRCSVNRGFGSGCIGSAQAQTPVTAYGVIDASYMYASKSAGDAGSVSGFQDAQLLLSIYGFRRTEDPVNGLKARFTLEGGFNSGRPFIKLNIPKGAT
jgi:predicted porin